MKPDQTILLIEDDQNDQWLIERAFRSNGIPNPIQVLSTGTEAICYLMGEKEFCDREKFCYPSLILTDLKMYGPSNGFDILEHLRINPGWGVIPTIVLTASNDPDDIRIAYMLGAHSYHIKPLAFDGLCSLIGNVYRYWSSCALPAVEQSGKHLVSRCESKLGQRFARPIGPMQRKKAPTPENGHEAGI